MPKSTDGSNNKVTTIQPCKGCERRHTACHDECEQYKIWKHEITEAKKFQSNYDRILQDDIWRSLTS